MHSYELIYRPYSKVPMAFLVGTRPPGLLLHHGQFLRFPLGLVTLVFVMPVGLPAVSLSMDSGCAFSAGIIEGSHLLPDAII